MLPARYFWLSSCSTLRLGALHAQEIVDIDKVKILKGHSHAPVALVFSSDSKTLYSGSLFFIKSWDLATDKEISSKKGHSQYVKSLAVSRDGKYLISGSWDAAINAGERCVKIWDLK